MGARPDTMQLVICNLVWSQNLQTLWIISEMFGRKEHSLS